MKFQNKSQKFSREKNLRNLEIYLKDLDKSQLIFFKIQTQNLSSEFEKSKSC